MLGMVSDEDYEAFKDILLEHLHKEWPKGAVAVDDGKHAGVDVSGGDFLDVKAEQHAKPDVEARVHEIAKDVVAEREWATEEYENYDEDMYEGFHQHRRYKDESQEDY